MLKLFTSPGDVVKDIKKKKSLGNSMGVLALAGVLFAITAVIGTTKLIAFVPGSEIIAGLGGMGLGIAAVAAFLIVFIGGIFLGWLLKVAMQTLGTKGDYFSGLSSIAYPFLILSVANLVSVLLTYVPYIGGLLAFLVTIILTIMAFALTYRLIKELFVTDMVTAFIGLLVVWAAAIAAGLYGGAVALGTIGRLPIIPGIPGL
jgi:hypothetical protein